MQGGVCGVIQSQGHVGLVIAHSRICQKIKIIFQKIIISSIPQRGGHTFSPQFQNRQIKDISCLDDIQPFRFVQDIVDSGIGRADGVPEEANPVGFISGHIKSKAYFFIFFFHGSVYLRVQITFVVEV